MERFIEKPSLRDAKNYLTSKKYFWNCGIFVGKASIFLQEIKQHLPDMYKRLTEINSGANFAKTWKKIKPISIDYGVMEHSKRIALIPADFQWTDLGTWEALGELLEKDKNGNIIKSDSIDYDSKGICAFNRSNKLIATLGLRDLIIADTPDALLVCDKHRSQEVKKIVEKLKLSRRKEHLVHLTERRPWGSYTVLQAAPGFKIKLVEIEPGRRLSLQRHNQRAEHWVVVIGCAKVTCGRKVKFVKSNQSIYIPKGTRHRLENHTKSKLQIVEVQTGSYLEEDDIERFEDDFKYRCQNSITI